MNKGKFKDEMEKGQRIFEEMFGPTTKSKIFIKCKSGGNRKYETGNVQWDSAFLALSVVDFSPPVDLYWNILTNFAWQV